MGWLSRLVLGKEIDEDISVEAMENTPRKEAKDKKKPKEEKK